MLETIDKFIDELAHALKDGTFVKLTLGNYKGADEHLQKILVRLNLWPWLLIACNSKLALRRL